MISLIPDSLGSIGENYESFPFDGVNFFGISPSEPTSATRSALPIATEMRALSRLGWMGDCAYAKAPRCKPLSTNQNLADGARNAMIT